MADRAGDSGLLEELRARAEQMEYREEVLFAQLVRPAAGMEDADAAYDPAALEMARTEMDEGAGVLYYRPVTGSAPRRFFRKALRKLLFFLLEPMAQDASRFNRAAVRAVGQLSAFAREQEEENRAKDRRIEELEKRIEELEKR